MNHLEKEYNSYQFKNTLPLAISMERRDEGGGYLSNSPDLLSSQSSTRTGISEAVAGPPLAGQPCHESTGSTLRSSAPSPALAFSTERLPQPRSQLGTQPILQINSPTFNSETRATAIDHQQKKQSCDLKSYLVAAEMQWRRSTFHHSAKRLSASS